MAAGVRPKETQTPHERPRVRRYQRLKQSSRRQLGGYTVDLSGVSHKMNSPKSRFTFNEGRRKKKDRR